MLRVVVAALLLVPLALGSRPTLSAGAERIAEISFQYTDAGEGNPVTITLLPGGGAQDTAGRASFSAGDPGVDSTSVVDGGVFTIFIDQSAKGQLNNIEMTVGAYTIEEEALHASCSQPLGPGTIFDFGTFTLLVTALLNTNGEVGCGGYLLPADEPPATEPPASEPPADEPPATEPPADEPPPVDLPPADEPTTTEPPADEPTTTEPPADEPTTTEPPADEPTTTEPPADEPTTTEPPATEPPSTDLPSADEPPANEPPADEPPVDEPPATEPPPRPNRLRT